MFTRKYRKIYITFSVPIKKKDNGKTTTCKAKFIEAEKLIFRLFLLRSHILKFQKMLD